MFTSVRAAIESSALRIAAVVAGRGVDERAAAGAVEELELGQSSLRVVEDVVRILLRRAKRAAA